MPVTDPLVERCTGLETFHYRSPLEQVMDARKLPNEHTYTQPERGMVCRYMIRVECQKCGPYNIFAKRIPTVHKCDHCQTRDVAIGDAGLYYSWPEVKVPKFSAIRMSPLSPKQWRDNRNSPTRRNCDD